MVKFKYPLFVITGLIILGIFILTNYKFKQNNQVKPDVPSTLTPTPTLTPINNWKKFTDPTLNISFRYPENLQTKYIRTQEWPPKISSSTDNFSCKNASLKTINGSGYCVESKNEAAAGTVYTDYTYSFEKNNKLFKLQFTLAFPQCANYESPQNAECEKERQTFDIDTLVDNIAQSIEF